MLRRTALLVALLLLGAGCTTSVESSDGPATDQGASGARANAASPAGVASGRNATDVAYAHELATMHQQAVSLVEMVGSKEVSPEARDLAAQIGRSRTAELGDLVGLLRAWGITPHGPDYHGNPGELTTRQLSDLYALDGAAFEEQWVGAMIANHRTAVAMSMAEVDRGLDLSARELARRLARTQGEQLDALERLDASR